MIRNRVSWSFGLMALLLTLGMAACGGNEPAPVVQPPAPPPAPPPFQPQAVEVALGESGNITLMTAEDGGFTLSGEKFESGGTVAAENGNMYILNLADGNWTAVYQAMEAMVTLGITEEVVTLTKAEDGTYWLGDALVTSGESTATAANGNMYTLSINDEGMWSATYQAVMTDVTLGITGDSVTLTRAEDGTYWLGDALVTSGMTMTMAMNGNEYTLSMNDEGMWSAMYIEPVQAVMLGEHGGSVMIKKSEDGSYWLGDVTVANGAVVTAANGNMYELMMDAEGMWSAAYQQVMVSVTLGITGEMASLVRAEDGSYWLGDALVTSGMTTTMSMNGNEYRLTMGAEGMWMAEYVPAMGTVMVGGSGITVPAMRDEAGTWTAVHPLTQETITLAEGGMITAVNALGYTNTYTLSSDGAGMWTASYVSVQQALALGSSGSSTVLVRAEDGTYWLGDALVTSGETTTMSENGNTYVLTMANGAWSAMFTPEEMAIAGTGLVATSREDQAGYDVAGGNITVTGTAAGQNVTVMEAGDPRPMYYRVWMADGALMGARTDRAIVDANTEFRTKGLGAKPRYNIDDRNTPTNEVNTKLSIAGESLSLSDLFDRGSASKAASAADGESGDFVNDAIDKLTDLRTEAELYAKYQADNPGNATEFDNNLERIARDAQTIINTIFDRDPADYTSDTETDADYMGNAVSASLPTEDADAGDDEYIRAVDTVRALTTLLDALSSQDAFVDATEAGNNGIFEGALGEDAAKKAFSANNSEYEVWFGSTAMTRYGAVVKKVRVGPDPDLADDDTYDADPSTSSTAAARYGMKFNFDGFDPGDTNDDGEITEDDDSVGREDLGRLGAFSYATTPETARARLLPQAGGATYEGGTIAVTPGTTSARENQLYSGMMRIDVNFRRSSVFGRISELKDKDNQLWQYLDRDVAEIYLPQRFYTNVGLFGKLDGTDASESATIVYTDTHGFPLPTSENTRARFSGRFIGPDGAEITGAWSIGEAVDDIDTDTTGTQTDDPRDIIYGSFGVMRTGDRGIGVAPGEDTSNGGGAETVVIPAGGEIKDSNLRLGMYNEGGDDENEFGLVQIFSQAGASWKKSVDTKPTFVKLLVDEINKQRNVYEVFVSFGDDSDDRTTSSNIGRQAAWSAINDAVRTYLFGTDTLYDADRQLRRRNRRHRFRRSARLPRLPDDTDRQPGRRRRPGPDRRPAGRARE